MKLNSQEIYNLGIECLASKKEIAEETCISVNAITSDLMFGVEKINSCKADIANLLNQTDIKKPFSTLNNLINKENGEAWNDLRILLDFEAFRYLFAMAVACKFIVISEFTRLENLKRLGEYKALISPTVIQNLTPEIFPSWICLLKEYVFPNMNFLYSDIELKKYLKINYRRCKGKKLKIKEEKK